MNIYQWFRDDNLSMSFGVPSSVYNYIFIFFANKKPPNSSGPLQEGSNYNIQKKYNHEEIFQKDGEL